MTRLDLVVSNARVVTCTGEGSSARERLGVIDGGVVGVKDGRIAVVAGKDDARSLDAERIVDARGRVLMPGLVDPHTHLIFAGSRVDEFARKMAGEDYRAIAAAGGGIAATVRATRSANDDELFALASARAERMIAHGVTTIECKSGYGLSHDDELRCLAVGRRLAAEGVIRTTTSLLAAHAVPPERRDDRAGYIDEIVTRIVPECAKLGLADACDAYIDEGAFDVAEARRVLEAARAAGLAVRAHVGQFRDLRGAELVAELGGLSADHLESVSDEGLSALARAGVVAVLLPGAWRTLRQTPPDAARLIAHGVSIAIGTDCNPGTSACTDVLLCAALAVRDAGLDPHEALLAVTRHAARAAAAPNAGRIEIGAAADLALYEYDDPRALVYALGDTRAQIVWIGGRVVHEHARDRVSVW